MVVPFPKVAETWVGGGCMSQGDLMSFILAVLNLRYLLDVYVDMLSRWQCLDI